MTCHLSRHLLASAAAIVWLTLSTCHEATVLPRRDRRRIKAAPYRPFTFMPGSMPTRHQHAAMARYMPHFMRIGEMSIPPTVRAIFPLAYPASLAAISAGGRDICIAGNRRPSMTNCLPPQAICAHHLIEQTLAPMTTAAPRIYEAALSRAFTRFPCMKTHQKNIVSV